jgi:two-component system alkaline phosphatase synthesis response regulator PhoP
MSAPARILVVEDHVGIAKALRANLEVEGHTVEHALSGEEGIAKALADAPALIILDLMLPGIDGFEVLRTLRLRGVESPVLILSALGAEVEKVRGFRLGADDYVTKPFGLLELLARVEALLRRGHRDPEGPRAFRTITFGDVVVELETRRVTKDGHRVELRPKEFDLLVALASRAGEVLSKRRLLREVWDYEAGVVSRTVDTHLLELRRKLESDPANPRHLRTIRGAGYTLEP